MAIFLTENDVKEILTMEMALDTVEESFRLMAEGTATNSPRSRIRLPNGVLNFMAGAAHGIGVMGF